MATKTQTAARRGEDTHQVDAAPNREELDARQDQATAVVEMTDAQADKNATATKSVEALERDEDQRERAEEAVQGDAPAVIEAEDARAEVDGNSPQSPTIPREVKAPVAPEPAPNQLPSEKFLPNAQRDAERFLQGAGIRTDVVGNIVDARDGLRMSTGRGPRDAKDLALFLRLNPLAVNYLDRLDWFETEVLGVAEPDDWERRPEDMLEEAKRYNMLFPNPKNNAQITDPLSHVERD